MKRFSTAPDLITSHNQGVCIVVPSPGGRLASLVEKNDRGGLKGWLFSHDEDHPRCGWYEEGDQFIAICEELGLWVDRSTNFRVPFSSGPRRRGEFAGKYSDEEYRLVRRELKLPSPEQLLELLRK